MNELLKLLRSLIGAPFATLTPPQLLVLGARLLPVVPDLMDGDPRLTAESRLLIQDAVAAFQKDVTK